MANDTTTCSLAKCTKPVDGLRRYCCPSHAKIGHSNKMSRHEAKKAGKKAGLCAAEGCSRMFVIHTNETLCHKCRPAKGCNFEGCGKPIPKIRGASLYCCDECQAKQNANRHVRSRAKKLGREIKLCSSKKCGRIFSPHKNSLGNSTLCPSCKKNDTLTAVWHNNDDSTQGKMYHDFRVIICKQGGKDCKHYAECSDSYDGKKFIYLHNGNNDCYVKPNELAIASFGNPLANYIYMA